MTTKIFKDCAHIHEDPTEASKQFFGENFDKMITENGHIYGCDRGFFKDDHCNSRCPYKEKIPQKH